MKPVVATQPPAGPPWPLGPRAQLSDEDLVLACRRGDPAAWETLVARYQRLIYTVPRRAGLSEDQAADVFQHVFAMLVEQIDRIAQPARIGAWLVTTARRESWRLGRREAPMRSFAGEGDTEDPAEALPDDEPLPEEQMLRIEAQHAVRAAVGTLDERCRTLLTSLFYRSEPPSYAEIAAALGTPEGSIGPMRARCLQKLRRLLEKAGV